MKVAMIIRRARVCTRGSCPVVALAVVLGGSGAAAASGTATSSSSFTVTAAPTVTGFTPASGATGASVVITGTGFGSWAVVKFNGTVAPTRTVNSSTSITATVPSNTITGPISVTMKAATATSSASFTVTQCPLERAPLTGTGPAPSGVIASQIYNPQDTLVPGQVSVISNLVFEDRAISGVDLFVRWDNIETGPDQYDWSFLDCLFSQADKYGKFVVLTLAPGFYTPKWLLYNPTSNPGGAPFQDFAYAYLNAEGQPTQQGSTPRALPLPWSTVYLDDWFGFLDQVADRYELNPAFRMIEAAGPTSVSTEMSLPDAPGSTDCTTAAPGVCDIALPSSFPKGPFGAPLDGSDIAMWTDLGYTPAKELTAWKSAFKDYAATFPHQYIGLAVLPGLPIPGSCNAACEPVATDLAVIAAGSTHYKKRFVVQSDGLSATNGGGLRPYPYVQANCSQVVTGFQTHAPAKEKGNALQVILSQGIRAAVDFIEIYAIGDVVSIPPAGTYTTEGTLITANGPVIRKAGRELHGAKDCAPLRLTASSSSRSPTSGALAWTLTASVAPALTSAVRINIYQGDTLLPARCTGTASSGSLTTTCTAIVSPFTKTTYTADVARATTVVPYSDQAVASASTSVQAGNTGKPGKGTTGCKKGGSTCR